MREVTSSFNAEEVEAAVRLVDHRVEKLEFAHLTGRHRVGRDVFHADAPLQSALSCQHEDVDRVG